MRAVDKPDHSSHVWYVLTLLCSVMAVAGCMGHRAFGFFEPYSVDASVQQGPAITGAQQKENTKTYILNLARDKEIARLQKKVPFLTMKIGPYRVHKCRSAMTDGHLYLSCGGDCDWMHSFLILSPFGHAADFKVRVADMRRWKTELGFGYGSKLKDVVTIIGEPTKKIAVADFTDNAVMLASGDDPGLVAKQGDASRKHQVYVYRWNYNAEVDGDPYPACYTLALLHEDGNVTGILIDVEEAI